MPYREKILEPKYWTIGEIADELMIPTSKIRFWLRSYHKIEPKKNKRGTAVLRKFNQKDRSNIIDFYYFVVIKKHTIEGAIDRMNELLIKTD